MAKDEAQRVNAVLKKYERESDTMTYKGWMAKIVAAIAIAFSVFQLYTATFGVLDAHLQRAVHLGFGLTLIYLLYPMRKSWSRTHVHPLDLLLAILGAAAPAYIVIEYQSLVLRSGLVSGADLAIGVLGIVLVVEAASFLYDRGYLWYSARCFIDVHFPLYSLWRIPRVDGAGQVLHRPCECACGMGERRPGKGCCPFFGAYGNGFRQFGGECRRYGFPYDSDDEEAWLSSEFCRCC